MESFSTSSWHEPSLHPHRKEEIRNNTLSKYWQQHSHDVLMKDTQNLISQRLLAQPKNEMTLHVLPCHRRGIERETTAAC